MKKQRMTRAMAAICLVLALLTMTWAMAACQAEEAEERSYNCNVYTEQGCDKMVIASGGEFELQSGATLDIQDGATVDFSGGIDLDGSLLDIDADGDTSIQADTDDQVDLEIGGADEFVFTADQLDVTNGQIINIGAAGTDFSTAGGLTLADTLTVTAGGVVITAGGLDMTADAISNIGNAGTDFSASGGLTLAAPLLLPDGAIGAPALANTTDTDTGLYRVGQDNVGLSIAGALDFDWGANDMDFNTSIASNIGNSGTDFNSSGGLTLAAPLLLPDGAVGAPAIANTTDTNTGFYRVSEDIIGVAMNGALDYEFEVNDLDFNTSIATNIGNSGTDFDTNGGLTTAAGVTVTAGGLDATGDTTLTLGAAELVVVDGATASQTQTAGALDINAESVTANTAGLDVLMTATDGTTGANDIYGARFAITNNDADADMRGIQILASATANAAAGGYEYGLAYDCTEDTATACTDGILLTSDGVNLGMTDGLDVSAANILNAVNIGVNPILGTNSDSFTVGVTDDAFIFAREDAGAVTYSCADDNANADCIYDSGGTGNVILGSADTVSVTVDSDIGLAFSANWGMINNLTDGAFDFSRNEAGVVSFICSDDDATAGCIYDAGGAAPIVVGSVDVTGITLTTAGNVLTMADAPAASSGGDFLNLAGTFAIANGSDAMVGLNVDITGANHTGTDNSTVGIDLGLTTPDPQVPDKGLLITDTDWDYAIDAGAVPIFSSAQVWAEDFFGAVMPTETVLLNGSDGQALDPAIAQGQYGIVELVAGDSQTSAAADGSVLALGLHWSADQASLVFETRVHVDDITDVTMCVGLSDDIATVEIPFTLTGDTDTGVADDFIGFCFDTGATTDEWWFVGNNSTAEATGNAATGVAPANGVFQVLRVEVDANGEDARGYIDGTLEGTITADSVAEAILLSPHISVQSHAAATRTMTLDYIYVGAQRQ